MSRRVPSAESREPPRYRAWLAHVFDRPEREWYFSTDEDIAFPDASAEELAELFTHTMLNCGADLTAFSDVQVAQGLNFMTSNACSDVVCEVMRPALGLSRRRALILSLNTLYADCFARRCVPALSHNSGPGAVVNPLNMVCYMFWDVSPLSAWHTDPDALTLDQAVVDVLEAALELDNPACQESALHGLSHARQLDGANERIIRVVQTFLATNPVPSTLKAYAEAAAAGCVQ